MCRKTCLLTLAAGLLTLPSCTDAPTPPRVDLKKLAQHALSLKLKIRQRKATAWKLALADPILAAELTPKVRPTTNDLAFPSLPNDQGVAPLVSRNQRAKVKELQAQALKLVEEYQRVCARLTQAGQPIPSLPVCDQCAGKRIVFGPTRVRRMDPQLGLTHSVENRLHLCASCDGLGFKTRGFPNAPDADTPRRERPKGPPTQIDLKTVIDAYESHPRRADKRYRHAYVAISGTVQHIAANHIEVHMEPKASDALGGLPSIVDSIRYSALCYFAKENREAIGRVSNGDAVVVHGWIRGYSVSSLAMEDCVLK